MFILHTSNRAENLLEHLVKILETPQQSVFSKELFLIQSQGMERWLSQQLAQRTGLWANFEYLFPARFFNTMSEALGMSLRQQTFSRENLLWQFEAMLRELKDPVYQPLTHYLSGDSIDRKRYQLAQQLAYLFDQYQFMRPDWLALWERGEWISLQDSNEVTERTQRWQSALWRQLLADQDMPPNSSHTGERWLAAIDALQQADSAKLTAILPERISIIGINTLSPMYLAYLQALSQHTQVHFYLINPCQEFWADSNQSIKQQLKQQALRLNTSDAPAINPLLAMLGQQGRDFQSLLLEQQAGEIEVSSFAIAESSEHRTLLQQLQNDILYNQAGGGDFQYIEGDRSVSVHACHSRMREVEVLKDQLLACFEDNPELNLRDVVVMAPDIQAYQPYIDAAFDDIPYAVADRSLRQINHLLDILLRFFALSQSRMLWSEVLGVLEEPAVGIQFGLFEADLLMVRHWIEQTRIRWGESALHREALGVSGFGDNSWQAGLERLLMGYAVPSDQAFCDDILPYSDIEGSQAQALGGFYSFFKLLKQARKELSQDRSLAQWLEKLSFYAEQLLVQDQDFEQPWGQLREMFESLAELSDQHTQSISLTVFTDHLEAIANEQKTATGFMRGQLTFCSMLPMRAIPFSVIALLGMNEGEFPNVDGHAAFDLMESEFRRGDRSRRADERYQFLEIIVSARQQLIISYVGRSIKTNDDIPPSVVVSELLEVIQQYYQATETEILSKHPLQAHSARYFEPESSLFSYSEAAAKIANCLRETRQQCGESWWQGELADREPVKRDQVIELQDLFRFYNHPQRYFIEHHLQLRLEGVQAISSASEAFELDNLEQFLVNQEWLARQLENEDEDPEQDFLPRLRAEGRWPQGAMGDRLFKRMSHELGGFIQKLKSLDLGEKQEALDIDVRVGDYRIKGTLDNVYQQGNLLYRYARCKAADQLRAWLTHLIYTQSQQGTQTVSYFLHMDGSWQFSSVDRPQESLSALLDTYYQAQAGLSPLLPPVAMAYMERIRNKRSNSKKTPTETALETYQQTFTHDAHYQLLYRNGQPQQMIESEAFGQLIETVFQPMYEAKQGVNMEKDIEK